jgi:hypothetical protein
LLSLAVLTGALASAGCVERILQVRSQPPGAAVYVNGEEVGATPCDHDFSFYGTVDVTLRAPGHVSHRELKTLSPPWYQFFPLDFVTDLLVPWPIRDVHEVTVELAPSPVEIDTATRDELREKVEEMRPLVEPVSQAAGTEG